MSAVVFLLTVSHYHIKPFRLERGVLRERRDFNQRKNEYANSGGNMQVCLGMFVVRLKLGSCLYLFFSLLIVLEEFAIWFHVKRRKWYKQILFFFGSMMGVCAWKLALQKRRCYTLHETKAVYNNTIMGSLVILSKHNIY